MSSTAQDSMKKAYVITIYNHIEYFNKFIKQLLSDGTSDVFVHVDKKYDYLKNQIAKDSRVYIIDNNISVEWGGWSQLLAIIELWKQATSNEKYDWIILCSGQDIMVKKNIDEYLLNHRNEIFIDSWEDDKTRRSFLLYKWPKKYFRIIDTKLSLTRLRRVLRIKLFRTGLPFGKRKINYDVKNITFYKNWFWSCIPGEVIEWILHYMETHPDYIEVFKGYVAEEGFITTTIMLSPYKDWIKFDDTGKSHSLTYRRPSINNHPPILVRDDIKEVDDKEYCFFARKVSDIGEGAEFVKYYFDMFGIE